MKSSSFFSRSAKLLRETVKHSKRKISLLLIVMIAALSACGGELLVSYLAFPTLYSNTFFSGVRGVRDSTDVYITGTYTTATTNALLYQGPLLGGGKWYPIVPSSTLFPGGTLATSLLYGPDNSSIPGEVNLVGTYTLQGDNVTYGFFYSGPPNGSGNTWLNIYPSSLLEPGDFLIGTVPHSNMNGFIVGNFASNVRSGRVFIYNLANSTYYELTKQGTTSISAYGIWWNGGTSYTIAGGYRDPENPTEGQVGYLVDWNSSTQEATNWKAFNYQNEPGMITHFEGISGDGSGGYTLASDWSQSGTTSTGAAFAHVTRNSDSSFGTASWVEITYPNAATTTANTVYYRNAIGVYTQTGSAITYPYVATVQED